VFASLLIKLNNMVFLLKQHLARIGVSWEEKSPNSYKIFLIVANFIGKFFEVLFSLLRPIFQFIAKLPLLKFSLVVSSVAALFLVVFVGWVYVSFRYEKDDLVKKLENYKDGLYGRGEQKTVPPITIHFRDGSLMGEYLPIRDSRMTLARCKQTVWLSRAAVSSEDRVFYEHKGVSYRGIFRAIVNNILSFSFREGGGSITQQLARNLFTDRSPTLTRKLQETFQAFMIEDHLSKEEILCLYLNKIYMGEGRVGAEEASWFYFRKAPEHLTAAEASMIVGLFPSPVRYSPLNNIERSLKKQKSVLTTLVRDGHLKEQDVDKLIKQFYVTYGLSIKQKPLNAGSIGEFGASRDFRLQHPSPAGNEYVRQFLYENLGEEFIAQGGLHVYTTIDPVRQSSALQAVRSRIAFIRNEMTAKAGMPPDELKRVIARLNGAMFVLDPFSNEILALVGGYTITEGSSLYDRIFKMRRQPGSAIKGFLYATALDKGTLSINTKGVDEPLAGGYSPRNWYGGHRGEMTLKQAVALSVNTVAVKTLQDLGVNTFRDTMSSALGIDFFEGRDRFTDSVTIALGSSELTVEELAKLYGTILNQGTTVQPYLVTKITGPSGDVLYEKNKEDSSKKIFRPEACAEAIYLLTGVMDDTEEGTASFIGKRKQSDPSYLPFPVAGKSGTVQSVPEVLKKFPGLKGVHDAWFVGIVPDEVSIVWIGQEEGAPFPGGGSSSGGVTWAEYAQRALPGKITRVFPQVDIPEEPPLPEIPVMEPDPVPENPKKE